MIKITQITHIKKLDPAQEWLTPNNQLATELQYKINHTPAIRRHKIKQIKANIANGQYRPDLERVVDVLLNNDLYAKM